MAINGPRVTIITAMLQCEPWRPKDFDQWARGTAWVFGTPDDMTISVDLAKNGYRHSRWMWTLQEAQRSGHVVGEEVDGELAYRVTNKGRQSLLQES